jgi:hypothetical protein
MISKPIIVKPLDNFKIWLEYEDGTKGEADRSHLKGNRVFKLWDNYDNFKKVYIDDETEAVAWNKEVELDPTNLFLKVVGKTF